METFKAVLTYLAIIISLYLAVSIADKILGFLFRHWWIPVGFLAVFLLFSFSRKKA